MVLKLNMNRIKRECGCFLNERGQGLGPMQTCVSLPLTTLNRPDVHQEIVNRYAKYSQDYWAGVKVRQLAYLRETYYTEEVFAESSQITKSVCGVNKSVQTSVLSEPRYTYDCSLLKALSKPNLIINTPEDKKISVDEPVIASCMSCLGNGKK